MTTESFLASDPFAILHIPRCVAIARSQYETLSPKRRKAIDALIDAAERADYAHMYGPDYRDDEAEYDARVAAVNAAGTALLKAVGQEYT